MVIQCSCGNVFNRIFDSIIRNKSFDCEHCTYVNRGKIRAKKSYENVKNFIETYNCKLLTTLDTYETKSKKLSIMCNCGRVFNTSYDSFKASNFKVCGECVKNLRPYNKQKTYQEVKSDIESRNGYILLSKEYKNSSSKLEIQCSEGHIFFMDYNHFIGRNHGCKICSRIRFSGENHPNWKGGISKERDVIKATKEYKEWRYEVFKRDKYKCVRCGHSKSGDLEAHHILNFSQYPNLRLEISNGITLCKYCHNPIYKNSFHSIYGVKENTKEQLEEYISSYSHKE